MFGPWDEAKIGDKRPPGGFSGSGATILAGSRMEAERGGSGDPRCGLSDRGLDFNTVTNKTVFRRPMVHGAMPCPPRTILVEEAMSPAFSPYV